MCGGLLWATLAPRVAVRWYVDGLPLIHDWADVVWLDPDHRVLPCPMQELAGKMQGLLEERARLHLALHTIKEMTNMMSHGETRAADGEGPGSIKAARGPSSPVPEGAAAHRQRQPGAAAPQRGEAAERPLGPRPMQVCSGVARPSAERWGLGDTVLPGLRVDHCPGQDSSPRLLSHLHCRTMAQAEAREPQGSHRPRATGHPALCPEGRAKATLFYSLINPFETGWVGCWMGEWPLLHRGCTMMGMHQIEIPALSAHPPDPLFTGWQVHPGCCHAPVGAGACHDSVQAGRWPTQGRRLALDLPAIPRQHTQAWAEGCAFKTRKAETGSS